MVEAVDDESRYKSISDLRLEAIETLKKKEIKAREEDIKARKTSKEAIEKNFAIEKFEIAKGQDIKLPYFDPRGHYRLIWESPTLALEDVYFWFINFFSPNCQRIDKLRDIFSASPQSSFFGSSQARLGATEQKVSEYLISISKMSKDALQILRELRGVNERLEYYENSGKNEKGLANAHEIALRDIWVNLVEGGGKNTNSVIGLATQVGFSILPNLFFTVWVEDESEIDKVVDALQVGNRIVKDTLKKKLAQFIVWKKHTHQELKRRQKFNKAYIEQQMSIIKMYVNWIKPYIYYTRKMQMRYRELEKPELISSFENALAELELLILSKTKGDYHSCVLVSFNYMSKPELSYVTEYPHRGPRHTGHVEINIRSYAWNKDDIRRYRKLLELEDAEVMGFVDQDIEAALKQLVEFTNEVIEESKRDFTESEEVKEKEEEKKEEEKAKAKQPSIISELIDTISDPLSIFENKEAKAKSKAESDKKDMLKNADDVAWTAYKLFKKGHRMLAW